MVATTDNMAELRRKAEEQIASKPAVTCDLDAKRLLHELQVHQLELEMQNEELRQTIVEKSEREARLLHEIEERRMAEAKLAENAGILRDVLESTLSGFWDWNLAKNTEYLSPTFKQMFGYEDHEMENSPEAWQKIIFSEDLPGVLEVFDRHVKSHGRAPFSNEVRYRHRDGSTVWVICAGRVIEWADDGTPIRMVGCHVDITEQKRANEALEKRLVALIQPLGNTEKISFEELFNLDEIQLLQDEFARATAVASIITRPDGVPITKPSNFCRLCIDIIRKSEIGCANCLKSDEVLGQPNPAGPTVQTCLSGGLWDAGAAIYVGDRHIASWLIGQVRDEEQSEDKIRAYARIIGSDEDATAKAFLEVPAMSRTQLEQIASMLFTLANQISKSAYQNVQQARFITERKRAEEALRKSESKLSTLFASMSEMVVLHELLCDGVGKPVNYRITDCNAAYTRITGITRENAVGRLATEVYGTVEPPYLKEYSEVAQSGEPYQYETYFPPLDKHFFISVASQGKNRFATVTTDITESKRMEHEIKMSEERFRLILESVSIVPWEFNITENSWTYVGHQVADLLGYAPEEWTTQEWWLEIIHPEDKVWVPTYCADLTSCGEEHSMDYRLRAKDGSYVWVHELVTVEMLDGKPHIMRGVMIDITERKQAEEAIEAARTQLAAKNKELEQLVYVASHDLRSPLVNVDGFSRELEYSVNELRALFEGGGDYVALEKALRAEFPDMVKSIGHIRASTRQMDNLLKAMLKLARAGRAALRIETLNMDELIGQLAPSFAYRLRDTGMTMIVEQLPPCQGDAVQATQVFSNLIDNAINYHEKGRPGVITIRGTAEGGRALYRVEDNGIGIAENHREKIFELFHRLNPKRVEGEGLGLTMVRQILGGMNGEITVESKPGEGSTFIVSLPSVKKYN